MDFNDIISKVEKGIVLSPTEEEKLYKFLGFKGKALRYSLCLILLAIGAFVIVISMGNNFLVSDKNFYLMLTGVLIVTVALFKLIVRNRTSKIVRYLGAVDKQFSDRFRKYKGFLIKYADFKPLLSSTYLQKDRVHFLTDGHNFIIYDDILKDTEYCLPSIFRTKRGAKPLLRIYDSETIDKKRISFEVNDIKNFRLRGDRITETEFKEKKSLLGLIAYIFTGRGLIWLFTRNIISGIWKYATYTVTKTTINDNRYTILVLKNETTYKFGPEVYELLLETIPQKENV